MDFITLFRFFKLLFLFILHSSQIIRHTMSFTKCYMLICECGRKMSVLLISLYRDFRWSTSNRTIYLFIYLKLYHVLHVAFRILVLSAREWAKLLRTVKPKTWECKMLTEHEWKSVFRIVCRRNWIWWTGKFARNKKAFE